MSNELIQLSLDKILQTRSYSAVVLNSGQKKFAIYMEPSVGNTIQNFLTEYRPLRPSTFNIVDQIFENLEIKVKQIVINDVQDTIYFCKLFLETEKDDLCHILEIDARPSDCLILALKSGAPLFCTKETLDKTIEQID